MCNCLLEILKCPGKVVCCCCDCACKMLCSLICSAVVLLVIIGLIVYFTVYYHKDSGSTDEVKKMTSRVIREVAPQNFRDFFKAVN
ncbi:protein midgut expression 1 [Calliphora vicina]|uniref:protein midgut expression 1 n=1 Tax=Calliphora vicina TaxID=7373 RepID=UPI00325A4BB8